MSSSLSSVSVCLDTTHCENSCGIQPYVAIDRFCWNDRSSQHVGFLPAECDKKKFCVKYDYRYSGHDYGKKKVRYCVKAIYIYNKQRVACVLLYVCVDWHIGAHQITTVFAPIRLNLCPLALQSIPPQFLSSSWMFDSDCQVFLWFHFATSTLVQRGIEWIGAPGDNAKVRFVAGCAHISVSIPSLNTLVQELRSSDVSHFLNQLYTTVF